MRTKIERIRKISFLTFPISNLNYFRVTLVVPYSARGIPAFSSCMEFTRMVVAEQIEQNQQYLREYQII